MVKPSAKKDAVSYLKSKYRVGIAICCALLGISRSTWYYESKIDDSLVIEKLQELARKYRNRGFDNYYHRLKREGFKCGRNRLLRIYRALGYVRRPKKRRKLPEGARRPLNEAKSLNEVWSMDFMRDCLIDGRQFRILNIIDDFNRESLLSKGSITYPSARVIRELEELIMINGVPRYIRTDNGPEFISKEYTEWCATKGIIPIYSSPGKPMENGYIERFNRTFREDILDAYLFDNIDQFNLIAQRWAEDYNATHPHESLGNKSPQEFGRRVQPSSFFIKKEEGCT